MCCRLFERRMLREGEAPQKGTFWGPGRKRKKLRRESRDQEMSETAIEFKNISKQFGTVYANKNISLKLYKGEILALLGENGSGKTTLMNMLAGIYYPDEGSIAVDGKEVSIRSPKDALSLGIGMVHQHFKLVDVLTATENVILGLPGKLNIKEAETKIREICDRYGFVVDPNKKIYDMTVSEKQTVEIVKVLYRGVNILILDEPTAVLTPQEAERLFRVIWRMRNDGKAVIIITHKMHEVKEISDRVAILRKGEYIGEMATEDADIQELTNMMVGRAVSLNIERKTPVNPKPKIEVEHLTILDEEGVAKISDVSFTANSGEILGIAGISGCGQKELLECISGLVKPLNGHVYYVEEDESRTDLVNLNPLQIQQKGIALSFVPEDRLGMGLVGSMDIADNMMLRSFRYGATQQDIDRVNKSRFLENLKQKMQPFTDRKTPRNLAQTVVEDLNVVTPSINTPVSNLSGGNVQKVLVGREIASHPKVLMTAYAVRGLDINSSYQIYDLINKQKESGTAVIYVGEDLDVLLELSDRILVLCGGRVSGIIDGRGANKEEVGLMMTSMGGEQGK